MDTYGVPTSERAPSQIPDKSHRRPTSEAYDAADSALIVFNHFVVEVAFYSALAFCMSTEAVARRCMRARRYIDRGAAVALGALGIRLLPSRQTGP